MYPPISEMGAVFIEHVERLIALLQHEKFAILQARKFGKYYARQLSNKTEFFHALNNCNNLSDLIQITKSYF